MNAKTTPSTGSNKERADAVALLRRSSAAGPHAAGARRQRTRRDERSAAIAESMEWSE